MNTLSIKEADKLRMTEWGDARFTTLATCPVVRQRQANVRGVLAFVWEVADSPSAEMSASMMAPAGSHAAARRACCRCVGDLAVEDEGDGGSGPSPFVARVNEVVAALGAAYRSAALQKELMLQLLGCLYDVPHFGTWQYEGLLDPGGHREVFVRNATFMSTVKNSLNSARGYLERSRTPADMEGMMWYCTELQEKLE
jgi:hypothetical protein